MGMYTEFHLDVTLKMPNDVYQVLAFMVEGDHPGTPVPEFPNHKLFIESERYKYMLACTYWSTPARSYIEEDLLCYNPPRYNLHVRCRFKNYDHEIENFLDWIVPYVMNAHGDFLGYSLYESLNTPTLYFLDRYHVNDEHVTVNRIIESETVENVMNIGLWAW